MTSQPIRRAGGILLVLVWAQVATANAAPCIVACLLDAQHSRHTHIPGSRTPPAHHSQTRTVSGRGRCEAPQLVVAMAMPPDFPAPPAEAPPTHLTIDGSIPSHSVAATFDTPPPRPSFIV